MQSNFQKFGMLEFLRTFTGEELVNYGTSIVNDSLSIHSVVVVWI